MIIFDLDGTLAYCEHRRHLVVDPIDICNNCYSALKIGGMDVEYQCPWCNRFPAKWKCDYQAFYEACDKDVPIIPVIEIFANYAWFDRDIVIWSGRCESIRDKTIEWLRINVYCDFPNPCDGDSIPLKMRPIGDFTPDEELKEKWLDEAIAEGKKIDFVFDDRPKVIRMWRRRGIFVFNCAQHEQEF